MLLRQVHRKDAKSGQRRLNFLLCKTAEKDDKRLWGPTWKEMGFVKKSQGQLEMCELEILRLKAREREAIAAVSLSILKRLYTYMLMSVNFQFVDRRGRSRSQEDGTEVEGVADKGEKRKMEK